MTQLDAYHQELDARALDLFRAQLEAVRLAPLSNDERQAALRNIAERRAALALELFHLDAARQGHELALGVQHLN
ncbi:hypothetical protein [Deinococcus aquaedulcis]|uniref:hypothetical protein n=1 Tax=Deinococcus aquaedulcis TaxID=2840455 RepID=UPI001C82C6CA|nr:hypothetical protein [Deinococcus aquaedulcis]